jgi:hypothetical protein
MHPAPSRASADASRQRRRRRWDLLLVSLAFLAVAGFFGNAIAGSWLDQWRASRSFQPVSASVVRSEALRLPGDSEGEDMVAVVVTFRYEAGGATRESQREAFYGGRVFDDWIEARDHAASFAPGAALRAYVDPDDPAVAVRDVTPPGSLAPLLGVALLAAAALTGLALGWRGTPVA